MSSGLSAVLETAALMHASGQSDAARTVLEEAISSEPETAKIPLVWLALLDIYQQTGNRDAFERMGMEYAVRFEQSPPIWVARNESSNETAAITSEKKTDNVPIFLRGDVVEDCKELKTQIDKVLENVLPETIYRLDLRQVTLVDEKGAAILGDLLRVARQKLQKTIIGPWPEKLVAALKTRIKQAPGKKGQGYWLLLLELLQWRGEEEVFERCAFDFAVRFELSPPAWSPVKPEILERQRKEGDHVEDPLGFEIEPAPNVLVWKGAMQGNRAPQLEEFKTFMGTHDTIIVDMHDVLRVDFAFGGALVNQVSRAETAKKVVRFIRTSPIVLSLLLLVGLPSRMFSRHR
jgi:ABC-type transporter Mla MlaB component